jgi:hypothetical protein
VLVTSSFLPRDGWGSMERPANPPNRPTPAVSSSTGRVSREGPSPSRVVPRTQSQRSPPSASSRPSSRGLPNTAEPRGAATFTRENNGSPATVDEKSLANVVQMWCAAPLDAPRGADFSPSHVRDLDFLWSGRRDSNPRPSPWQGTGRGLSSMGLVSGDQYSRHGCGRAAQGTVKPTRRTRRKVRAWPWGGACSPA